MSNPTPIAGPGRALGACLFALALAAFLLANFGVADSDFFWHLRHGYTMLESGSFAPADAYSHTARGESYAYYSWLAEIAAALLHRLGGFELVVLAKAAAAALLVALLWLAAAARGARGLAVAWALLCGLLLLRFRLYARPEIFTLLLIPLTDLLVQDYFRRGRRLNLILLPLVAMLWANLHPYVLVGLVLLSLHAAGEAIGRAAGFASAGRAGRPHHLGIATGFAAAATLLNPWGFAIYTPALKLRGSEAIAAMPTREWAAPTLDGFALFFALAAVAAALLLATFRRCRVQDLAIFAATLFLALTSLRNIGHLRGRDDSDRRPAALARGLRAGGADLARRTQTSYASLPPPVSHRCLSRRGGRVDGHAALARLEPAAPGPEPSLPLRRRARPATRRPWPRSSSSRSRVWRDRSTTPGPSGAT